MLDRIYVLIWEVPLWDIEGIFCYKTSLFRKTHRPLNSINFFECFKEHLDNINLDNEIFLHVDFNINLIHNGKYILKENRAMQNCIRSTSLVSQYKLFCQRYSLEQIIKHATPTTCDSCTLIDRFLQNQGKNFHKIVLQIQVYLIIS